MIEKYEQWIVETSIMKPEGRQTEYSVGQVVQI